MSRLSILNLAKWLLFASTSSLFGLGVGHLFQYTLNKFSELRSPELFFILPIVTASIVGLILYRWRPDAALEGVPGYLQAANRRQGRLSISSSIVKFLVSTLTLSFGGSGGVVGPLVRINSGLVNGFSFLFKRLQLDDRDRRTITICGASSVLAVIFNAPVGAGFFAVEILKRAKMGYLDLFPSIITSCLTISLMHTMELSPLYIFNSPSGQLLASNIPIILAIGIASGFFSLGYTFLYSQMRKWLQRDRLRIGIMILSLLCVSAIGYFVDPNLLGTSLNYFDYLTSGKGPWMENYNGLMLVAIFFILAFMKAFTNCLTVASGLSAGFTGPVVIVGLFIGSAAAVIFNVSPDDPNYYAFLVAGISGMLSASMNIPLAAAIMGAEIFGITYALPATLSSVIAFQIARSSTMYDFQFEEFDEEDNIIHLPYDREKLDRKKAA